MSAPDFMSPEASPGTPGHAAGVRRVNKMPLVIFGGILLAFTATIAVVASKRATDQSASEEKAPLTQVSSSNAFAREIVAGSEDGLVMAAAIPAAPLFSPAPAPAIDPLLIAKPPRGNPDEPPAPPNVNLGAPRNVNSRPIDTPGNLRNDDEMTRIRQLKLQQLDEAVKSRTSSPLAMPAPGARGGNAPAGMTDAAGQLSAVRAQLAGLPGANPDPATAYQARMAQVNAMNGGGGASAGAPGQLPGSPAAASSRGYGQFGSQNNSDRWRLDSNVEAPRTPFELRAGAVIPATLISGINSEIPGQIMAQVSQNVYDTATGKRLLIPQGARLVGPYSSDVGYGQARLLVAWQRIVFPDGKAFDLGAMPGSDSAGYAGFSDEVNNHYIRLFASAFLMSGVTAGITYSQRQNQAGGTNGSYNNQSASGALSEALGQQLGQVTAQLIAKNMSIAPTLQIRPGYRFNVVVTKDLTFQRPYTAFDY